MNNKKAIYKILGLKKDWSNYVDDEHGNADYLMFADVDYSNHDVVNDVKNWGVWIVKELGLKGFRLDAVQHFSYQFTGEWIDFVNRYSGTIPFIVGEFWTNDAVKMLSWLAKLKRRIALFDSPLVYNFSRLCSSRTKDLRRVFDKSLVQLAPSAAVVNP